MMVIVDAGSSYKSGVYLPDKSDVTTIQAFNNFHTEAETMTRRKICHLRTDQAFESIAWEKYCQHHGIMHKFTAPYSSAQNGLAERAIRTTIDDVHTLLHDSNLSHLYWAEAAAYSIETWKKQDVGHLYVFGAKCWAKIPTTLGGSKLNPRSTECHLLDYASGSGNYKVQDITSHRVFISCDIVFEEGRPCHTLTSAREHQVPLFDTNIIPPTDIHIPSINDLLTPENSTTDLRLDQTNNSTTNHQTNIPIKPRQST